MPEPKGMGDIKRRVEEFRSRELARDTLVRMQWGLAASAYYRATSDSEVVRSIVASVLEDYLPKSKYEAVMGILAVREASLIDLVREAGYLNDKALAAVAEQKAIRLSDQSSLAATMSSAFDNLVQRARGGSDE